VAQVVECLASKHEASTTKTRKREKGGRGIAFLLGELWIESV
jgi:hypothetical protein